jgi:hypothetical protein
MNDDLERHRPSPAARRRAEGAGLDLDALRRDGASFDVLEYGGAWFCDVLRAGEA